MSAKKTTKKKIDLSVYLDEIRERAFEVFLERQRNNISGDDLADWLAAEEEIKKKYNIK